MISNIKAINKRTPPEVAQAGTGPSAKFLNVPINAKGKPDGSPHQPIYELIDMPFIGNRMVKNTITKLIIKSIIGLIIL